MAKRVSKRFCCLKLGNLKCLLGLLKRCPGGFALRGVGDKIGDATCQINGGLGECDSGDKAFNVHNEVQPYSRPSGVATGKIGGWQMAEGRNSSAVGAAYL